MFSIDYDNVIVNKMKVKDRDVYIIDNFYKYPERIVKYFKKQNFKKEENNYYPGDRLYIHHEKKLMHLNAFRKFMEGNGYKNVWIKNPREWKASHFMISKYNPYYRKKLPNGQAANANPHVDAEPNKLYTSLVGLCYLTKDIHGGTGLYRHKKMDIYSINEELTKEPDIMPRLFPYWDYRLINKSCDHFELMKLLPMKWNRLVLYDGDILHSMYIEDPEFYKIHERITTNYFVSVYKNNLT
tara:strand:+ start:5085 stop:5807 length:723 start_codon:yes stop_codon:yes gene_type:complete